MEWDECMRAETIDHTVYKIIVRMRVYCGHDSQGTFDREGT